MSNRECARRNVRSTLDSRVEARAFRLTEDSGIVRADGSAVVESRPGERLRGCSIRGRQRPEATSEAASVGRDPTIVVYWRASEHSGGDLPFGSLQAPDPEEDAWADGLSLWG